MYFFKRYFDRKRCDSLEYFMTDRKIQHHTSGNLATGITLIVAALLSVFAMAHHPSGHSQGMLVGVVHGAMLFLMAALFFGFTHFALINDIKKSMVLAGLIAYSINAFSHFIAAMINGFVAPAMNSHGADHDILILCWETNQAFAKLGVVAAGFAFLFWGLHLMKQRFYLDRIAGLFGVVTGVGPAIYLLFFSQKMDLQTALIVYAAHAFWSIMIGTLMICRRNK